MSTAGEQAGTAAEAGTSCMAAVPVLRTSWTGRMTGGDPIIDHESTVPAWAECGEPAVAVHAYRCGHGHEKRRPTCPAHAPQPGQVGCRECYDQGHECEMTAGPEERTASDEH